LGGRRERRRRGIESFVGDREGDGHGRGGITPFPLFFVFVLVVFLLCVFFLRQGHGLRHHLTHARRKESPETRHQMLLLLLLLLPVPPSHVLLDSLEQRCPRRPDGKDKGTPLFIVPGHAHPAMRMGGRADAAGAKLHEAGRRKKGETGGDQIFGKEKEGGRGGGCCCW
jgi:hypothetical protein